ncbi:glycoside hydrolase family 19 [Paraburkholderia steynii]|uniref:Glycoside hydrolase family 19 n=1 Tax=Paraburkholderia steynii TaxID=1245441 RepID=A0A4R0XPM8_9BURK|nr:glycoside hydrolase family 19 [Paraburkholderia steynii]
MQLTAQIVASGCGSALLRAAQWVAPLQSACDRYHIDTPLRVAAFLSQIGVESARLTALVENLNYSAEGLLATFPKYFNAVQAAQYERQPQRIANHVYANRYGNGDEASGDGFRFRGRALLQITFRDNYASCGKAIALPLDSHPELLEQPCNAALAAGWYWDSRNLNPLADAGRFEGITRAINGGLAAYSERLALYSAAKKSLGI